MLSTRTNQLLTGTMIVVLVMMGVGTAVAPAGATGTDAMDGTEGESPGTDSGTAERLGPWWPDLDNATFESASAEVVAETDEGEVTEVTFRYEAPRGRLVRLQAGHEVEYRFGTGEVRQTTVDLDRWLWPAPEPYPVTVSTNVVGGGERCATTLEATDAAVSVCGEDEPEAAFDVGIETNAPVTEGESMTVNATVENTGDANGTETATVSVADESTSADVSLAPGESTTVGLTWETESGDAGNYTATADVAGASASEDVTVEFAETEPFEGTVAGTITDNETGEPIADAVIRTEEFETTVPDGNYSVTLPVGDQNVTALAEGYEPVSKTVTVEANETQTVDFALDPEAAEPAEGTVEGTITASGTGNPIEGATVSAGDAETTTDANGSYSLTVPDGEVTVSAGADGYETATETVTVTANESTTADFELNAVVNDGTVEGTVTDNETGDPVEGATVSIDGEETTTGSDGSYSLTVAEGDYAVSVSADGYESASQDVSVTAGETTAADVALDPVVTEGTVTGTVTDNETGDPIAGATVAVGDASATTAADGSYSLTVTEGDYELSVDADGYQSATRSVSVTAGETTTADVALVPEPDPAAFAITGVSSNAPVTAGTPLAVTADVENTGDQEDTETVSLSIDGTVENETDVTLAGGASTSVTLSTTLDAGEYEATVSVGDASESTTVTVEPAGPAYGSFQATGQQDGTIVLANDTEDPILIPECDGETPLDSPEAPTTTWEDACFTIDATIQDGGTWSAAPEDIHFPQITSSETGVRAEVQMSAPEGLEGTIEPEEGGAMTMRGPLNIEAGLANGTATCVTETQLSATTDTSGELSGEPLSTIGDDDTATATVVDNTFTVPALNLTSGAPLCGGANSNYGLPALSEGANQFELEFLLEFDE